MGTQHQLQSTEIETLLLLHAKSIQDIIFDLVTGKKILLHLVSCSFYVSDYKTRFVYNVDPAVFQLLEQFRLISEIDCADEYFKIYVCSDFGKLVYLLSGSINSTVKERICQIKDVSTSLLSTIDFAEQHKSIRPNSLIASKAKQVLKHVSELNKGIADYISFNRSEIF